MKKVTLALILILLLGTLVYGMEFLDLRPAGDIDKTWRCVAVDGSHMLAGVDNGRLYTSSDYGENWVERQPAGDAAKYWRSCAISGSNMIATVSSGRLYTSNDYGVNWTERQPAGDADKNWYSCAASGTYMIAAVNGGRFYVSSDGGANWAEKQPIGDVNDYWHTCAISGEQIIVCSQKVYGSSDYGESWVERTPYGYSTLKDWYCVSISGQYMVIAINGSRIYTSLDYGVNWTKRTPAGDVNKNWYSCAISGAYIIAGISGGRLYTSEDYGVNWTERQPAGDVNQNWYSCAADGDNMIAGAYQDRLWRLYEPPTHTSQYPPEQSDVYVKATSKSGTLHWPYFATDPTKLLIGISTRNSWAGGDFQNSNQRFHIDLGSGKIIKRIYYENFHSRGINTTMGAENFTFWGSNTAGDFADLVYVNDGTWVDLTLLLSQTTFDQHVALDREDPKFITVTNSVAYRYYAFKFADNYGAADYMAVRRIELQTEVVEPPLAVNVIFFSTPY